MKIGISRNMNSYANGRWKENTYKKMSEHGYSAVDYNLADTNTFVYTMPEEEADKILKEERILADSSGIDINQVHGPWRYPPRDFTDEDRNERMDKMKRSIRASYALGSKFWIVHPIMPFGLEDIKEGNEKKTWDINVAFMKELLVEAKKYDITICLENMPFEDFSLSKPEKILEFVKEINDDNFMICLDTGHITLFDDLDAGDEVRKLGKYIKTFHIHDTKHGHDFHLMPFFGDTDWKSFGKSIKDIGFDGVFSYETSPSNSLPDDLFEEEAVHMVKIAKYIIGEK